MTGTSLSEIPDFTYGNFQEMLVASAARYPKNIALRMKNSSGMYDEWTYGLLKDGVWTLASFFYTKGLKKGDHLGLLSENRPEWCIAYLAAVVSGIIIVPFDSLMEEEGCAMVAEMSDLDALCVSDRLAGRVPAVKKKSKGLRFVIDFDLDQDRGTDFLSYRKIMSETNGDRGTFPGISEITEGDPASIIFTSGTTGTAKGVVLSQRGIIANASASINALPINEHDNFIAVIPFYHTYPTTCSFISPLMVGAAVTIAEKIIGTKIIANIKETGGTILISVPLLFDKIAAGLQANFRKLPFPSRSLVMTLLGVSGFLNKFLKIPAGKLLMKSVRKKAGLASMRLFVAGGGPLAAETSRFFEAMGFNIVQGYGMSENGPLISTNTQRKKDNASVGLVVRNTEVDIRDPDAEGNGEIIVKSPSLMLGYYKNPDATADMFTEDGFLKTGDIGRFDKRGFLYITGRIKNIIVTPGGKNIYPEEIEALFGGSQVITEIMITGRKISSFDAGEAIIAVIYVDREQLKELYPEQEITMAFIEDLIKEEISSVNKHLATYQKITGHILRDEEFEKTASGKIKRFLYRDYGKPRV